MHALARLKPKCSCDGGARARHQTGFAVARPGSRLGNQSRLRRLRVAPHRCAACEQEERARRAAKDDPDKTTAFPREAAPTGTTSTPAPGPAPTAAPSPGACCDTALARGLDAGDLGGIICCNNTKIACVWQANINRHVTNAAARPIVERCVRVHETTHLGQVDCTGAAVERPNFRAGVDPDASECTAYRAEIQCYNARLNDCGTDTACRAQVTEELAFAQRQVRAFCHT
jgi:hypothetical protein